jgi:hypothetical protein
MVVVDVEVTAALELKIEVAVLRERVEHVIEEADARPDLCRELAVAI